MEMQAFLDPRGWAAVPAIYAVTYLLSAVLPGKHVVGYACDSETRRPLTYKLNGLLVHVVMSVLALAAHARGVLRLTLLIDAFPSALAAAFMLGMALSLGAFVRGRRLLAAGRIDKLARCLTADQVKDAAGTTDAVKVDSSEFDARSALEHFYCGFEWNPRGPLGVDLKMQCYAVGAVMLQLLILAGALHHAEQRAAAGATGGVPLPAVFAGPGTPAALSLSWALLAFLLPMTFFLIEYMGQEAVHLLTYDLIRERMGFKLYWGCACFYPFFYSMPMWAAMGAGVSDADMSCGAACACIALFFGGWLFTRGANLQKFAAKSGAQTFLGMRLRFVPGSQGRLVCSQFWGLARHVNYLGEIVQASAVALGPVLASGAAFPLLYPLYYVGLFIGRERDDDAICAVKYGAVWDAYRREVPWRIVPYVY